MKTRSFFKTTLRSVFAAAVVAATILTAVSASAAIIPLVEFSDGQPIGTHGDITFGYNFTTGSNPINFNHLGIWDWQSNGLGEAHQVGLWNSGGTLLVSGTVPTGTAGLLKDDFRYVSVGAQTLAASTLYVLGAFYPTIGVDPMLVEVTPSMNFGAIFGTAKGSWPPSAGLAFPTSGLNPTYAEGFFGPNLAQVPEPGTLALFGIGLVGLGFARRKRMI